MLRLVEGYPGFDGVWRQQGCCHTQDFELRTPALPFRLWSRGEQWEQIIIISDIGVSWKLLEPADC